MNRKRKKRLRKKKEFSQFNEQKLSQTNQSSKSLVQIILQAEILIALGLIGLYSFSYLYYLGYYYVYHIPYIYIDLTITKLTAPSLWYFLIISSILFPLAIFYRYKTHYFARIKKKKYPVFIIGLSIMFLLFLYLITETGPILNVKLEHQDSFDLLFVFVLLISVLLYLSNWAIDDSMFKKFKSSSTLVVILIISILCVSSLFIGAISAIKYRYPIIIENGKPQNKVILDTYKDFYITTTYKKEKNRYIFSGDIELIEIKPNEKTNPLEIDPSNGKYKMKYEEKNIKIKEVPFGGNIYLKR